MTHPELSFIEYTLNINQFFNLALHKGINFLYTFTYLNIMNNVSCFYRKKILKSFE